MCRIKESWTYWAKAAGSSENEDKFVFLFGRGVGGYDHSNHVMLGCHLLTWFKKQRMWSTRRKYALYANRGHWVQTFSLFVAASTLETVEPSSLQDRRVPHLLKDLQRSKFKITFRIRIHHNIIVKQVFTRLPHMLGIPDSNLVQGTSYHDDL